MVFLFNLTMLARASLAFALGVTCIAVFFALRAQAASEQGRRLYLIGATLALGLLSLYGSHLRLFGGLTTDAIEAVGQTDRSEAFGYLVTNLAFAWALMWAVSAALLWLTFPRASKNSAPRRSLQGLLLVAALALMSYGHAVITEPVGVVNSYREGIEELRKVTLSRRTDPLPPIASDFTGTIIVVLGESASRHHLSIYGYPRQTTPHLSSLKDELVVFEDVISTDSSTVGSLVEALALRSPAVPGEDKLVGILQLATAAGFETSWLSNQNEFGVWDNPVRIIAQQADFVRYHDPGTGRFSSRREFDEAMLPSLDERLATPSGRKLIIVHPMSTHLPYCWTKPKDFNPLRGQFDKRLYGRKENLLSRVKRFVVSRGGDLDCYDNGIRYSDRLLGAVIARAKRLSGPAAVLYLSDHGEAPLLSTGHDSRTHSSYHLEIPFVLWANEAYRARHSKTWRTALANRSKPFSLDRLSPTIAGLLALDEAAFRQEDNLFGSAYRTRPRTALNGYIRYDARWKNNDYRENSRVFARELGAFSDRVWAHRVNSLGALLEAKRTFSGVEIDVHFDPGTRTFQVRHSYPHIGLTLRDMLEWSRDRPAMRIWLDWKNATPENVRAALIKLIALDREFALKRRLLVETDSTAVSPELAIISKAGFQHGYYLPTEKTQAAMRDGNAAMDKLADDVKRIVLRGRFDAVTYDATLYPFVRAKLDDFLTQHRIRRYSWDTSIDSGRAETDPAAVAAIVRERRLEALLVRFPSDFRI